MRIVKTRGEKEPTPEATLLENLKTIAKHLGEVTVSSIRQHSVDSHLRGIIRVLGFRPRETGEKPADNEELCRQAISLVETEELHVERAVYDHAQMLAKTTISNLAAEAAFTAVPLPEVPARPAPAAS